MKEKKNDQLDIPFQKPKKDRTDFIAVRPFSGLGKLPGPAVFGIIAALVIAAGLAIYNIRITVYGRDLPVLSDAQPDFEGYEGIGTPKEGFAPESEAVAWLLETADDRSRTDEQRDAYRTLAESIHCSFSKTENLSNNETVTYACSFDPAAAESAKINLTDLSREYTVHALKEYTMINPFLGVSAYWSTEQGIPEVELQIPQEYLDMGIQYDYTFIDDAMISITIDADYDTLQESGIMLSFDSMEYPVSNKPELIMDTAELSDDEKAELRSLIENLASSELDRCGWRASFMGDSIEVTGIREIYVNQRMFSSHSSLTDIKVILEAEYNGLFGRFATFSVSYTGYLYRMADGTMEFRTEDTHACSFSGVFGEYTLQKER